MACWIFCLLQQSETLLDSWQWPGIVAILTLLNPCYIFRQKKSVKVTWPWKQNRPFRRLNVSKYACIFARGQTIHLWTIAYAVLHSLANRLANQTSDSSKSWKCLGNS